MKPTRRQLQLVAWRKRRERALKLRENGMTLDEIALAIAEDGKVISRERVRQMLIKAREARA